MTGLAQTALELADWRRQTQRLYADVRATTDPAQAHAVWRQGRDSLFRHHPQSPLGADDLLRSSGVPYAPYDPGVRWTLPLEPVEEPLSLTLDTGQDGVTRLRHVGWVGLPAPYESRLAVWWMEQYGGGLFVPVRDGSAGTTSYGGGRYLLDTAKGADLGGTDDALVIDLNFLYHPSCRYDPAWVCPLAPGENTLSTAILAGEQMSGDTERRSE